MDSTARHCSVWRHIQTEPLTVLNLLSWSLQDIKWIIHLKSIIHIYIYIRNQSHLHTVLYCFSSSRSSTPASCRSDTHLLGSHLGLVDSAFVEQAKVEGKMCEFNDFAYRTLVHAWNIEKREWWRSNWELIPVSIHGFLLIVSPVINKLSEVTDSLSDKSAVPRGATASWQDVGYRWRKTN